MREAGKGTRAAGVRDDGVLGDGAWDDGVWDDGVLAAQGDAHFMQSEAWAQTKAGTPWRLSRTAASPGVGGADAPVPPVQLFSRRVPGLGTLVHAPRLTGVSPASVPELTAKLTAAAPRGAFAVKAEFFQVDDDELAEAFRHAGWMRTLASQYRHAVSLDITGTEDEAFARFKKRARYEVRAAERGGVSVRKVTLTEANVDTMVSLVSATKDRSGAFFRDRTYLERTWSAFSARDQGDLYLAEHDGEVLAGAFVFRFGRTAWYKDGGSVRSKPKLMAPRYLQWQIIRDLRERGIERYELGNIPAPNQVEGSSGAGLYRFKTAFSDRTVTYLPAFELPLRRSQALWHKQEHHWLGLYARLRHDYWY